VNEPYALQDAAYAAARWGSYLTTFLALGAGSYAPFLFRSRAGIRATDPDLAGEISHRAARIGLWSALGLLGFHAVRLYLQSRSLLDPTDPLTAEFLRAVIGSGWGKGWLRQLLIALIAMIGFVGAARGSRIGWMVAAAAGGGAALVAGMTGHAATERSGPGGMLLDAAHVLAGGLWLGGLAVMLAAGMGACRSRPAERRPALLRALVADFSRRALVLGPIAIGLGVWLAARYLGWGWPLHLLETGYGKTLGVKLLCLAGVAVLGAWNWRVVQPALAEPAGEGRLRKSGRLELILGLCLLAATAVMVALPLPGDEM
jgi:putative copper export protein